ncbi:alkanesulfonate monooxygenase SsuD/methylene tetrahydromethanopterin reductase-like flavin-dependent oxidoreductase (luciferase family) [Pseudonocardia eucalypti]|uniref:LLM class flavin-dependent oxidoreductase n=1 Tax=Pseudonocardia eucalypti TaxID=648755 RepID=UPI001611A65A|nr:alkanesulfonate monooxygenase SsuD/methylene tetrahydromethanopterin reductase-like flavin-dependent oxidoreductase (luciferase family) [Pseudonocardia eucalypti]
MNATPLSVLDLSPVPAGGTAADALRNTVDLAQVAERCGYHRFWVAEHHLASGVASSAPGVLVALVAAATDRIRVGSGAVQMPNLPALVAAEQFGTVAALHPGRIDLGLGRFDLRKILNKRAGGGPPARLPSGRPVRRTRETETGGGAPPGIPDVGDREVDGVSLPRPSFYAGDPATYQLLGDLLNYRLDEPGPVYGEQLADILAFLEGRYPGPDGEPLPVLPAQGADLEVWVFGTTPGESARAAGAAGLPFAASYHILPTFVLETVAAYREAFRPSRYLKEPHVMVSADVVVADDDTVAAELAAPYGQWVLDIKAGRGAKPYVTPAEARARVWTEEERAGVADRLATQFVGSPETVVGKLRALVEVTGADELVVTTITTEHADRVRSHELLAKHWIGEKA